jgi:hypothetical protein
VSHLTPRRASPMAPEGPRPVTTATRSVSVDPSPVYSHCPNGAEESNSPINPARIVLHPVRIEESHQFLPESNLSVMLRLLRDIPAHNILL